MTAFKRMVRTMENPTSPQRLDVDHELAAADETDDNQEQAGAGAPGVEVRGISKS